MTLTKKTRRAKIRRRIRGKISGSAVRPRLSVYKSLKHIYVQIIDDEKGVTIQAISTKSPEIAASAKGKPGVEKAAIVGKSIGQKAKEAGIEKVVFDRSGYRYHGKIKALADAAREAGLQF
jgi:large subunit ribosomal protein L18